jgi:hypothetical protein
MLQMTAALTGARLAVNMLGRILRPGSESSAADAGAVLQNEPQLPLAAGGESADLLREIVGRYNLTDISPGEVSSMLQELRQAGLIDDSQYHELSMIRLDLDAAGVDSDKSIDLLDFYADKLEELTDSAAGVAASEVTATVEPVQRLYNWLQKVSLLQSSAADTPALDATA